MAVSKKINKFVSGKIKLSIIVLSWNTQKLLEQCLKSIPFFVEIIVVDNASTDGTIRFLDSLKWPNLKVIKNRANLGFAKGNNQGIKVAQGDLVMLLNSDTIVQKGALEKLVNFYDQQTDKNLAFSPLLLNLDGTPQEHYYMRFPNLWQIFFYHHPLWRKIIMKTPAKWLIISHLGKDKEIDQLPGAALVAPKQVWQKVGLLDEGYQFLFEDVGWSWRAKKKGIKLRVVPESKITHFGGASWQKKLPQTSFEFYCQHFDSFLLFVKKNYGEKKLKIFRIALLLNFLSRFKFKLVKYFLSQSNLS
jgi:hypothetical protein